SAEIEKLRQRHAEHDERTRETDEALKAQHEVQRQAEIEARQQIVLAEQRIARLEAVTADLALVVQERAESEHRLNAQVEALRTAEAEHISRLEVATASLHAQEEACKKAEAAARHAEKRSQEEANQLAQLQLARTAALNEAQARAFERQKLSTEIKKLSKEASDHIAAMEAGKARLTVLEETRQRAETKARQRAERELKLQEEVETLQQAEQ